MRKQVLIIVSVALASFLIGTMFSTNYLASGKPPSVWDAINQLQSQVNALTTTVNEQQAQISELQSKVDFLNVSLTELLAQEIKTLRFLNQSQVTGLTPDSSNSGVRTISDFTWIPHSSADNAILSCSYYLEYATLDVTYPEQDSNFGWLVEINGQVGGSGYPQGIRIVGSKGWTWTQVRQWDFNFMVWSTPEPPALINQAVYSIAFKVWFRYSSGGSVNVRNVNVIVTVNDGTPSS